VDWNGDTVQDDVVLLHWSKITGVVDFVDVFADAAASTFVVEPRLYYRSASTPVGADETTLRFVDSTQPVLPVAVESVIGGGQLDPIPRAEKRGLLFLTLDEAGTQDLNGDGDMTDANVLALLDGTDAAGRVVNVALALRDGSTPFAAFVQGTSDWTVAFLVDELGQGNTNLNAQGLFGQPLLPESCAGTPDTDTNDQILHYLEFAEFVAGTATPVNTGLVGEDRILILTGFVATVASEADSQLRPQRGRRHERPGGALGGHGGARRARARRGSHARARDGAAGGSFGLSVLQDRLIAVVDEAADEQNIDGKAGEHDLVGWINRRRATRCGSSRTRARTRRASARACSTRRATRSPSRHELDGRRVRRRAPRPDVPRGGPARRERQHRVAEHELRVHAGGEGRRHDRRPAGVGGLRGEPQHARLRRRRLRARQEQRGHRPAGAYAYFRVSEADDNRDYNADGAKNDVVVIAQPADHVRSGADGHVDSLTSPVITTGDRAAAFQSSESQAGIDFNDDGDTTDLVVRYFLLP
jgi:hypothetical protein